MRSGSMGSDTWFRPVSPRPLAGLRVGLPLLLLFHLVWLSNDFLSLHGSRGIIPWELTDLLRDPWVPGLPTLAKAFLSLGIREPHRHYPSAVGLRRNPPLARSRHSHPTLGVFGVGPSPQPRDERVCFLLWCGSVGEHFPLLSLRLSVRTRLEVRVSSGFLTPRGNNSRRLPEGHASPSLRDLSRRRFGQSNGEPVVERRGHLADCLSARLQHFRSQLAGEAFSIPMFAGWGTLVVEIGYAFLIWPRRSRRVWCIATFGLHLGTCLLFMGLVFFSSVMILLTGCLFMIPEEVVDRAVATRRGPVQAALLVAICLLWLGREARGETARAETDGGETGLSPTSRPWSTVSSNVTRFRAWPWESSSGDAWSSPAASVTAMWTGAYR